MNRSSFTVARGKRDAHWSLPRLRCALNRLVRSAFIAAHEFEPPVDDHLRRIDTSQAKLGRVGALPFTVLVRREGVLPSDVVPVIDMLTQNDQFHAAYRLRSFQPLQQSIGWRATGTTLGCKQFDGGTRIPVLVELFTS